MADRLRALLERLGLGIVALGAIQLGEIVKRTADVGAELPFGESRRALGDCRCLSIFSSPVKLDDLLMELVSFFVRRFLNFRANKRQNSAHNGEVQKPVTVVSKRAMLIRQFKPKIPNKPNQRYASAGPAEQNHQSAEASLRHSFRPAKVIGGLPAQRDSWTNTWDVGLIS